MMVEMIRYRRSRYEHFFNAAERLLRENGRPMHINDIKAEVRTTKGKRLSGIYIPSGNDCAYRMARHDYQKRFLRDGKMVSLVEWAEVEA